jgi:hypothetical protein
VPALRQLDEAHLVACPWHADALPEQALA